jgi:hypothetical protein
MKKRGKIGTMDLSDGWINLSKDEETRLVLDHALRHYQQRLKNLVTKEELYGLERTLTRI